MRARLAESGKSRNGLRASGSRSGLCVGYGGTMKLDVYQTDAEAFDATATLVAEAVAATTGPVAVAVSGGRDGRGVLAAIAGRGDLPWGRIDWYLADERC